MPTLNLGILAHVDAGKTSLTERLLFTHGAVSTLGSVDAGDTTTDTGELERERGITIRAAVASFALGDLRVNLIDTPGHPDFIAEVERSLAVLDGAVLVVSAVEGVQAQTRVLMRSLRRLRIPTLIFVNKIDRAGARGDALLTELRDRLGVAVVPVNAARDPGGPGARTVPRDWENAAAPVLADHDDDLLVELVDGREPAPGRIRELLVAQTAAGQVHPVFFGSAITGEGDDRLTDGIAMLLRPRPVPPGTGVSGLVFAMDRGTAWVRLFSGEVRERQRVVLCRAGVGEFRGRVTALEIAGGGEPELTAGGIARVHGLTGVRVGDRLVTSGSPDGGDSSTPQFAPPGLESLVRPCDPTQQVRLHAALTALADEDPLIRTRAVPGGGTSVLLYGAVQREVLAERLLRDFGLAAEFGAIQPVYFEQVTGVGECVVAFDPLRDNEFWATVGLRVEPGPAGSGLRYRRDVQPGAVPAAFHRATEEAVRKAIRQGPRGWEVIDCTVTVIRTGYQAPASTAADFRGLAPIVLLRALRAAGTVVGEPYQSFEAEVPASALPAVLGRLGVLGAEVTGSAERGTEWTVTGVVPARLMQELTAALPGLTHGEGALWSEPGPVRPIRQAATTAVPSRGGMSAGHSGRANR